MRNKYNKAQRRSKAMRWIALFSFIAAFALALVTYGMLLPEVQASLAHLDAYFAQVESFIGQFNMVMALGVVLLLFVIKAFVPIFPFSVLFVGTGLVFPVVWAVLINAAGYALFANLKFLWSKRFGGGKAYDFLKKYDFVNRFMALEGKGNAWMLFLLNFVPFFPLGTVCRAYGATDMNRQKFTALSVLGFLPRLVSWSVVGRNITNPFTVGFTAPIIFLLIISGISLLLLDAILKLIVKDEKFETL